MAYVEFLRVRRALFIFSIVGVVISLLTALMLAISTVNVQGSNAGMHGDGIPVAIFFGIGGFLTWIIATTLGSSINNQAENVTTAWTKPRPRAELASQIIGVDIIGLCVAFVIGTVLYALVPGLLAIARFGVPLRFSFQWDRDLWVIVLMLGCAVMWYGMIQAVTAWNRSRGGVIGGISWPVFLGITGLAAITWLPPAIAGIVHLFLYLDPIAYVQHLDADGNMHEAAGLGLPWAARVSLPWIIGLAGCAIAALNWKRLEV